MISKMKSKRFLSVLTIFFLLSVIVVQPLNANSSTSVWGFIYVNGTKVTPSNAKKLVGEYPVRVHFDRLPSWNGDPMGLADVTTLQYLTGWQNLYYAQLRAGNGRYVISVRIHGKWRTCKNNVLITGNQQINCSF